MKFPWFKTPGTTLTITGHRYDDRSVALRVEMPRGFESQDVQPTNLVFPTAGCWVVEVTAGGDTLSFVTEAVKIGDGPTRAAAN